MSRAIAKLVFDDLTDRKAGWEDKQRVFYQMRHEGIRRASKPFPGAADLHYPLADGMIDKLKPFYWAQVFGNETIATFTSENPQHAEMTRSAAATFDYHIKEETNFFEEMMANIDNMLMAGSTPIKCWWNGAEARLEFDAIDPIFCVVPKGTTDLETADRVTHIIQMSVEQYKRDGRYTVDEETIRRIRGKGVSENDSGGKMESKYTREGMTCGKNDDQIVLWEVYQRKGKRIYVDTFAPGSPDTPVRKPFYLDAKAYPRIPIYGFRTEIKDKGYHAPRGVVERVAAMETYASRLWNEKADTMSFLNRPIFTHDGASVNLQNVRMTPGQIIGNNLRKVDMGQVPFDFDQELTQTRMTAEYQIGMPDFGVGQNINTKERKTATEVATVSNIMGQSNDLRAQIFRRDLAKLYRGAWTLLSHFAKEKLQKYYADNQVMDVTPDAIQGAYRIQPSGTADGWNRAARSARAQQRIQTYRGDPSVNQPELTRHALEEDDPRLVKRLWQDPGTAQAGQVEDQADELSILQIGFPARVLPTDDHAVHVNVIFGYLQAQAQLGRQVDLLFAQKMGEHVQGHLQALKEKDAQMAKQLTAQAAQVFAPFQQQMQQQQQQQAAQAQMGAGNPGMPPPALAA